MSHSFKDYLSSFYIFKIRLIKVIYHYFFLSFIRGSILYDDIIFYILSFYFCFSSLIF